MPVQAFITSCPAWAKSCSSTCPPNTKPPGLFCTQQARLTLKKKKHSSNHTAPLLRTLRKSANPSCFKALHSKVFSLADLCSVVPSARIYDMLSILLIPDYQHGCMWHLLCSEWYKDHFMACMAEAEKSEAPTIISLIYILFSLPFVFVFVSEDHFFFLLRCSLHNFFIFKM